MNFLNLNQFLPVFYAERTVFLDELNKINIKKSMQ